MRAASDRAQHFDDAREHAVLRVEELIRATVERDGRWQLEDFRESEIGCDAQKSTRAACRYLRELILDFGSGTSVMLALAAYNVGPTRVKQEIRKVSDPIKQRNFWYLYRVRALPGETRQYVPKVIAAMIIGRSPERFGF